MKERHTRILEVDKKHVAFEFPYDELGILHFALYEYLAMAEKRLKKPDVQRIPKLQELKEKLVSMVETVNGVI